MWNEIKSESTDRIRNGFGRTENGALTYNSTGNHVLDLFFKIPAMRSAEVDKLWEMFDRAWKDDPYLTIRVMLWVRDARGGAGERRVFREFLKWLEINNAITEDVFYRIIDKIPEIGRWDDMFVLFPDKWFWKVQRGLELQDGLLAKWLPREKSKKWPGLAKVIARNLGLTMREYRKLISSLSKTVEQQMSANEWDKINYSQVPSIAGIRYRNAFLRHDEYRYREYIEKVKRGEEKMNLSVAFPYHITSQMMDSRLTTDELNVLLTQWEQLPNTLEKTDGFILPMVDLSGSMKSKISGNLSALDVAVSLGVYIADKQPAPWNDIVLTFSENPRLLHIPGNVYQKVKTLLENAEVANTNLQAAFDLILSYAKEHNLKQEEMPKYLLIISDMEFDVATFGYSYFSNRVTFKWDKTNHEVMKQKFLAAGYEMPKIIYWNVMSRSTGNLPVREHESGAVLISGYSTEIMKQVMELDESLFNPIMLMLKVIGNPRYDF